MFSVYAWTLLGFFLFDWIEHIDQVKKAAVDIVQGLTGSEDGLQALGSYSDTVLPPLSRLLGEKKVIMFFYVL